MSNVLGADVGGTGMKMAPVDLATGEFAAERVRQATPDHSTPDAVAELLADMVSGFESVDGPVGVTIPGVVRRGVVKTAANIDSSWIGTDAESLLSDRLGRRVVVLNDADAAGLAEVRYGAAADTSGLIILTTLGTGIGSAIINDGALVPNTELGHLVMHGDSAEKWAANSVRKAENLGMGEWAERLTAYYRYLERLFSPDLFVVGGGISKEAEEFLPLIDIDTELRPAQLLNKAGVVGAAMMAGRLEDIA